MSGTSSESTAEQQQREMAEVQEQMDAESEGDGLAAEAGSAEENGIFQG
ncbi:hypothetical protein [Nocardioides ferulae]|nr:hypothetical protein [Nocardioides ferulae]